MILSFFLMIASVIIFGLTSLLGIIYTLFKALFTWNGSRIAFIFNNSIKQIKNFFIGIAIIIDEFGNVYGGELLEYTCTYDKNTLFMHNDVTISAAIGYVEAHCKFTPFGFALRNLLNRTFEPNHCLNAYEYLLREREVKKTNEFNNWIKK